MEKQQHKGWFTGRNRWVTIASIAAVGVTGAIAVSANIGILNASNKTDVGNVAAASDLTTPSTQVVDVYLHDTTTTGAATTLAPATTTAGGEQFAIDTAGVATVSIIDGGIRLDSMVPTAGWAWSLAQPDATHLTVTVKNGTRTLEFNAALAADGTIQASVTEPIVTPAATAPATQGGGGEGNDNHPEGGENDD